MPQKRPPGLNERLGIHRWPPDIVVLATFECFQSRRCLWSFVGLSRSQISLCPDSAAMSKAVFWFLFWASGLKHLRDPTWKQVGSGHLCRPRSISGLSCLRQASRGSAPASSSTSQMSSDPNGHAECCRGSKCPLRAAMCRAVS